MNINQIVETVTTTLDSSKIIPNVLPPFLLKCTALTRSGLSAYKIAAQIIENNKALNIPTEENPDGSDNKINQYTYNVVKCIVDAIKNDAVVHMVTPSRSLLIQAIGANAGGAVTCTGTNLIDSEGVGLVN